MGEINVLASSWLLQVYFLYFTRGSVVNNFYFPNITKWRRYLKLIFFVVVVCFYTVKWHSYFRLQKWKENHIFNEFNIHCLRLYNTTTKQAPKWGRIIYHWFWLNRDCFPILIDPDKLSFFFSSAIGWWYGWLFLGEKVCFLSPEPPLQVWKTTCHCF